MCWRAIKQNSHQTKLSFLSHKECCKCSKHLNTFFVSTCSCSRRIDVVKVVPGVLYIAMIDNLRQQFYPRMIQAGRDSKISDSHRKGYSCPVCKKQWYHYARLILLMWFFCCRVQTVSYPVMKIILQPRSIFRHSENCMHLVSITTIAFPKHISHCFSLSNHISPVFPKNSLSG